MANIKIRDLTASVYRIKRAGKTGTIKRNIKNNVQSDASDTAQASNDSKSTSISDYANKKEEKGAEDAAEAVKNQVSAVNRKTGTMAKETYKIYKRLKKSTPEAADSTPNTQSVSPKPTPRLKPESATKPTLKSTPKPTAKPTFKPTTQPTFESAPKPESALQTKSAPKLKPESAPKPTPKPTLKPESKPVQPAPKPTIKSVSKPAPKPASKPAPKPVKAAKSTLKTARKSAETAVKTAKKTGETTVKTAKFVVKSAKTTEKAAATVGKTGVKVVQTTVTTAKATATLTKAAVAAIKAAAAAIKEAAAALSEAIAASAPVSVPILVILLIVGIIAGSAYGIFAAFDAFEPDARTIRDAVQSINQKYEDKLHNIRISGEYDYIDVIHHNGNSISWSDVLTVYAIDIIRNASSDNPPEENEVYSITPRKEKRLRKIFDEMNKVTSREETIVITETEDENGNTVPLEEPITEVILHIEIWHTTAEEMAYKLSFTDEEKATLKDMLAEDKRELWINVLYDIAYTDEQIVLVAANEIGNEGGEQYGTWYDGGRHTSWCAIFVSWCANECGYIESGIMPKTATCEKAKAWYLKKGQFIFSDGLFEPSPGMIIFFDYKHEGETHHTGIVEKVTVDYSEDGQKNVSVWTIEGNARNAVRERCYNLTDSRIVGYGCPAY